MLLKTAGDSLWDRRNGSKERENGHPVYRGLTKLLAPIQDSMENLTESHFVSHFTDLNTEAVDGSGSSGCPTCS